MKTLKLSVVIVVLTCMAISCAVIGRDKDYRPFDDRVLAQVVPGKTTAEEITKLFGAPSQVVKLSTGNAYIYTRSISKTTGLWFAIITFVSLDKQYDQIVFFLNNTDIVTHFGKSLHAGEAAYGLPF
jgi:hypothetical protein